MIERLPVIRSGSGPAVVLVHGRGSASQTWDPLLPWLDGYTAIRVDLTGHGQAPAPEDPAEYALDRMAAVLDRSLDDLTRPFALVGHSMGGFVALRYVVDHPARVRCLGLEATSASPLYRGGRFAERRAEALEMARLAREEGMVAVCDALERRGELGPGQRQRYQAMTPVAWASVIHATLDMEDLEPHLGRILAPTLVVCGLLDRVFVDPCRRLAERIPGARGLFLPGIGHSPHREAAEAMGRELRAFLDEFHAGRAGARA